MRADLRGSSELFSRKPRLTRPAILGVSFAVLAVAVVWSSVAHAQEPTPTSTPTGTATAATPVTTDDPTPSASELVRLDEKVNGLNRAMDLTLWVAMPLFSAVVVLLVAIAGLNYVQGRSTVSDMRASQLAMHGLLADGRRYVEEAQRYRSDAESAASRTREFEAETRRRADTLFAQAAPEAPSADGPDLSSTLTAPLDVDGAIGDLLEALPTDSYVYFLIDGKRLYLAGRSAEAVEKLRRARELKPEEAETRFYLGKALAAIAEFDEGIREITAAIDLGYPHRLQAEVAMAQALLEKGDVDLALVAYRRALEVSPRDTSALLGVGFALERRGSWDDAAEHWAHALSLHPRHWNFLCYRGRAKLRAGDVEGGIQDLELVKVSNPGDNKPHLFLAEWQVEQGLVSEALRSFERAIELGRGGSPAFLAAAHARAGQACLSFESETGLPRDRSLWPSATNHFRQATELVRIPGWYWLWLSTAHFVNLEYERATIPAHELASYARRDDFRASAAALLCIAIVFAGRNAQELSVWEALLITVANGKPNERVRSKDWESDSIRFIARERYELGEVTLQAADYAAQVLDLLEGLMAPSAFVPWPRSS